MENETIWVNEGFILSDAGHLIGTSYIDLRSPGDRTPITSLVKGCERKYALEDCETILISKPARFRSYGEELILDVQEGLAKKETVIALPATTAQTTRGRAISDLNSALELLDTRIRPHYSESCTNTDKTSKSLTYAKEWWIFSTSIRPENEERATWRCTLPKGYDHVSEIGQPAKFAQALSDMVAEQIGPQGKEGWLSNTTGGVETEKTQHKTQWVMHGPVFYTDSVFDVLEGITDNELRMAALIFTKGREYEAQREYRFAVLNEGADKETVILQISGMMRDALRHTEHGLVRHARVTLKADGRRESEFPQGTDEPSKLVVTQTTKKERSTQRRERKLQTKGPDGEVLSSDVDLRESVKERTITQGQVSEKNELERPTHDNKHHLGRDKPLSIPDSLDTIGDAGKEKSDEEIVKELALEEFEFEEQDSQDHQVPIPVKTVTGRVYKSFEEMLSDPSYPMTPMGSVWQEEANTPEEIVKTYRAIDVLDWKMKNIAEEFRQDIASAGWYAMLCIRNIYGRLGDIVHTVSIEKERFVVIRLKESEALNARGRIVVAPSGAYAYSIHLPKEEQVSYGGLEWGTTFFPIGSEVETFEKYGWPKKAV